MCTWSSLHNDAHVFARDISYRLSKYETSFGDTPKVLVYQELWLNAAGSRASISGRTQDTFKMMSNLERSCRQGFSHVNSYRADELSIYLRCCIDYSVSR